MKKYFKKFSIIFVMALAIIGIGIIQNESVANAATVGQQLTAPENGWTRYDDTDSRIGYLGNEWSLANNNSSNISPSCYNKTYHSGKSGNIEFKFKGTEFRIIAFYATNDRSNNIQVNVDGVEIGTYSQFNTFATAQLLLFETTGLTESDHTVDIINNISGTVLDLDAIDINSNGYLIQYNESITLDKSTMNLNVGDSKEITVVTTPASVGVTWSSSDTSIATVDSTGKVTAIKEGQATITATMADGSNLSSSCTVNVTNPITPGITLNKTSDSLITGQTDNLVATTTPSGAQVTWTSSDTSIATVDSTGKITAIKEGTATITASTPNGLTAACALTVTNPTNNTGGTSTGTDGTSNIVNIAHAKGDNTNNAGGEVSIIFNGLPDTTLSVVKTADVKSVYVGDTFTYTIVATNTGAKTAKSVVISDSAPNHIQFMPSGITTTQGTVDPSSTFSNILVNVGDIPPLGTVTIKIPATVIA